MSRRRLLHVALKPASLAPLREFFSASSRSPILSVRRSCLRLSIWILHRTPFYRESEKQRRFTGPGGIASCTSAHRQFLQPWIQGIPRRLMLDIGFCTDIPGLTTPGVLEIVVRHQRRVTAR